MQENTSSALIVNVLNPLCVSLRSKGVILNISSASGMYPVPLLTVYSATKVFMMPESLFLLYEQRFVSFLLNWPSSILFLCAGLCGFLLSWSAGGVQASGHHHPGESLWFSQLTHIHVGIIHSISLKNSFQLSFFLSLSLWSLILILSLSFDVQFCSRGDLNCCSKQGLHVLFLASL